METEIFVAIIGGIFSLFTALIIILLPRWLERRDQRKPQTDENPVSQKFPNIIQFDKRHWWNQLDDNWKQVFNQAIGYEEKGLIGLINRVVRTELNDNDLDKIFNLQTLDCSNHQFGSLEPLRPLTELHILKCGQNQLSDLEPLRPLTQLRHLDCYANKISSLEPLCQLTQLQKLYCGNNQISNLEPLRQLTQLQELYCGWNQISDLEPLRSLIHLQKLHCSENQQSQLEIDKFKEAVPNCHIQGMVKA